MQNRIVFEPILDYRKLENKDSGFSGRYPQYSLCIQIYFI